MKRNRGVALAVSMFAMALITAVSAIYVTRAVQEKMMSLIEVNAGKAVYAAESGANDGLLTLSNLINFYMLNTVSSTSPSVVSSQASTYASTKNGVGFLVAYVKNEGASLLTLNGAEAVYTGTWTAIDNGGYSYTIRIGAKGDPTSPMANVWDFPFYFKIQNTAVNSGLTKKLTLHGDFTVRVQKDNFARYSLFTAHQTMSNGTVVWFTDMTHFSGPLFTDERFAFAHNPAGTFTGTVKQVEQTARFFNQGSSILRDDDANGTKDVPVFSAGFQRGAGAISFPTSTQQADMASEASGGNTYSSNGIYIPVTGAAMKGGIYVYGDASITLGTDGLDRQTMTLVQGATTKVVTIDKTNGQTLVTQGGSTTTYTGLPDGKSNVGTIVYVNGAVSSLKGIVQKDNQMTISTKNDMVISGNIRYQDYTVASGTPGTDTYVPPSAEGEKNLLGLLSWEGDIRIGSGAPSNLDIHSTLMAKTGEVSVDNYDSGPTRGVATVLGGVISNYYGAFGTFNSSTGALVSGYGRNFVYDTRMMSEMTPPYFPTTNTFIAFTNDIDDKLAWQQGGF